MITTLAAIAMATSVPEPVDIGRVFTKGEKLQYEVKSTIQAQIRQGELQTFLPQDFDINYKFTTEVVSLKADGIGEIRYSRPTVTEIEGETADSMPKTKVTKLGWLFLLEVSPINDLVKMTDLKPPAKKKDTRIRAWSSAEGEHVQTLDVGQFIGEIHRLSLFAGGVDSALDFSPKLPYDPVAVGETWKRTVGYSPQTLKGAGDKSAVQRLDYEYTYRGIVESGGRKVHRVTADLKLDTDAAKFINQALRMRPDQSGLKEMKLILDATIEFDLDLKTRRTLEARAKSTGSVKIEGTELGNTYEEKINGGSTMTLVASK
ncbi:MAG TPA: hypothetical protein PLH94_02310 [Fimbriimonadaceae bacterium]|nr:hypothetical protein [Fimbriimonadaceae bacterium]